MDRSIRQRAKKVSAGGLDKSKKGYTLIPNDGYQPTYKFPTSLTLPGIAHNVRYEGLTSTPVDNLSQASSPEKKSNVDIIHELIDLRMGISPITPKYSDKQQKKLKILLGDIDVEYVSAVENAKKLSISTSEFQEAYNTDVNNDDDEKKKRYQNLARQLNIVWPQPAPKKSFLSSCFGKFCRGRV
jgi:hypothetical protein